MKEIEKCVVHTKTTTQNGLSTGRILLLLNRSIMMIILTLTIIVFASLSPYFLSIKNLYAVGLNISVIGIVCIGQTLCILTRGFDLSVGTNAAFCGMLVAYLTHADKLNISYYIALPVCLLVGAAIGLINGILITRGKINALITTLATGFILGGGVIILSNGYSIIVNKPEFIFLGTTKVYGIPFPMIVLAILYAIFHIILKYTVFGRHIYCVGGNPNAARIAGINVEKLQVRMYMLSGILSAFAGIVLSSRMGAAQTTTGTSYALESIAAVVLGGTVLAGGEGKISGTFMGVIIIGILSNGLIMIGIPQAYRDIATGVVLLFAVLLQNVNIKKA